MIDACLTVLPSVERNSMMELHQTEVNAPALLKRLLITSVILGEDWDALPPERREALEHCSSVVELLDLLVADHLLTHYQANRISVGKRQGLLLGNYRILDRIGAGGMGVVYKAEHMRMRRLSAIKVFTMTEDTDPQLLQRFYAEMRTIAQLQHPNIVSAFDAGEAPGPQAESPTMHYYVMEYVEGQDLEQYIIQNQPLEPDLSCELMYQIASALAEAHRHHLVHRDIKPSNILITTQWQAKLTDFGLARHFRNRVTEPGTILGTVDYIAPEQAKDSTAVDIRADLYSLGGTLFWCLTGQTPFKPLSSITQDLVARLTHAPPSLRSVRPDLPADLDAMVQRLMAVSPEDRYPNPHAVMRALLPFLDRKAPDSMIRRSLLSADAALLPQPLPVVEGTVQRVLVVDDEADVRSMCRLAMQFDDIQCEEAAGGPEALATLAERPFDLVLLDIDMPGMSGMDVCRQLRTKPLRPNLKIVLFSGRAPTDEMARMLLAGADDFITKPFSLVHLLGRIRAALRLKAAQDRSERLTHHLLRVNSELENNLTARDSDLVSARNALVLALAKLVEQRHSETGAHLTRIQRYCRFLAEEAAQITQFHGAIDANFVQMLECCAPLHDIGKVALPDHILMKPGKLTPDERVIMQAHTTIGAQMLEEVAREHGGALAFLGMAIDITRHHHERFDGTGYPDRLVGNDIPISARLVALADVYDALRSRRIYKPALSHNAALEIMKEASPGHFDPALLPVLDRTAAKLERAFKDLAG